MLTDLEDFPRKKGEELTHTFITRMTQGSASILGITGYVKCLIKIGFTYFVFWNVASRTCTITYEARIPFPFHSAISWRENREE